MKPSKIISLILIVLVLFVPGIRNFATSYIQSVVLAVGLVNPSNVEEDNGVFDYNVDVKNLSGREFNLKQFQGKIIFLNIWATWCGPCRAEMPSIQKLFDSVDHDKIVFLMLSADDPKHFSKVKTYISDQGYTFPVVVPSGNLPSQLQVPVIPTTFVIDQKGVIVKKESGMRNYASKKFRNFLLKLLN
ncbi:MAG: TlpA family protein disulfide reductase [Bacteroidetes bacterium]|nr:TlpA family protein disulfide reductase [Bacteroidota bacterium]